MAVVGTHPLKLLIGHSFYGQNNSETPMGWRVSKGGSTATRLPPCLSIAKVPWEISPSKIGIRSRLGDPPSFFRTPPDGYRKNFTSRQVHDGMIHPSVAIMGIEDAFATNTSLPSLGLKISLSPMLSFLAMLKIISPLAS